MPVPPGAGGDWGTGRLQAGWAGEGAVRALCGDNAFVLVACGVGRVGAAPQAQREGSGKPSSTEQPTPACGWNGFLAWKSLGLVPDPQPCYIQGPKSRNPTAERGLSDRTGLTLPCLQASAGFGSDCRAGQNWVLQRS